MYIRYQRSVIRSIVVRRYDIQSRFFSTKDREPEHVQAREALAALLEQERKAAAKRSVLSSSPLALKNRNLESFLSELQKEHPSEILVYDGALSRALRAVKKFSLSSSVFSFLTAPLVLFYSSIGGNIGTIVGTLMYGYSFFSLYALHYVTKSYVRQLWYLPDSSPKQIKVEILTWWGGFRRETMCLKDLVPSEKRKRFTFIDTATGKGYFVHESDITRNRALHPLFKHVIRFPSSEGSRMSFDKNAANPTPPPSYSEIPRPTDKSPSAAATSSDNVSADTSAKK